MKKVMFVASSGGHLSELLELKSIFKYYDYLLITEKTNSTEKYKEKYNIKYVKYVTKNNIFKYYFNALYNVLLAFKYILIFKPKVIVTTGANTGGIFCTIAKLFRIKTVYIETIAGVKKLSLTGKIMYKKVDKFLTQWEELDEKYENIEYIGRLK